MQIPWLFPIFIFSLTFNKIPWLFPDFCQVWNFPDFSLTAGHPALFKPVLNKIHDVIIYGVTRPQSVYDSWLT